jgi:DNA invertase Pin-like site-specific DNA recombinase
MTLRAVIYARYSSENQREASLEDQVRLCKERVAAEGWDLMQVFQDRAISGATLLRPGYQALLAAVRDGDFDVIVAEALDRLSRDQEDVAALYKRARFAGIRIVTLAEGEVAELHVGLKGTMNALFLRDLAAKTHRGLRGRVEAGHSGGGNAYGYRVVHRLDPEGHPVTGERVIDPTEAEIVRRIFREYAAGVSPKRIAYRLNNERIAGPRSGSWSASTINGNRARGTGNLNNELYIGRLVWNRLVYIKDPETGRRRSRQRSDAEHIVIDVPKLRIVDQELWDAVKMRQADLDHRSPTRDKPLAMDESLPFWSKQRPRYLFSGLMRCGVCGGGFAKSGASTFACSRARNKGPSACTNRLSIRRDVLESTILDGLANRLMDPELFKVFVTEFTAEWNRAQAAAAGDHADREAELERVRRRIERLVDALADGTPAAAVNGKLRELEQRRLSLEADLANVAAPAPRLHPNLAEVYRQRVATLAQALESEDGAEARALVRSLIDTIRLIPEGGTLRVEIAGELAAILRMAQGAKHAKSAGGDADALAEKIMMVAGTRNRRSHYSTVPI